MPRIHIHARVSQEQLHYFPTSKVRCSREGSPTILTRKNNVYFCNFVIIKNCYLRAILKKRKTLRSCAKNTFLWLTSDAVADWRSFITVSMSPALAAANNCSACSRKVYKYACMIILSTHI